MPSPSPQFLVQKRSCSTCIYRRDTFFDIKKLEAQIADDHGYFKGHRICHHSKDVCCRGFWNRHKNRFTLGQLAQRLGWVTFVSVVDDDEKMAKKLKKLPPRR